MKFLKKIKDSKLNFILMLLYPIVTFYLLEWFTHNPWKTMKATPQVLNIIMFELIALLLFAAIGKLHVALMTETLFFFLYGLVNYFVLNFRSVPIQPWDLFSIRTAASVADNYEYTLDKQAVLVILGFLILLALEFFCRYSLKKGTWKFRVPTAAVICGMLVAFGAMFHSDEIVQQKLRLYDKLFTPTTISFKNGTALAFVMELRYISVDKPAGYNAGTVREELEAYSAPEETPEKTPNIIVIMNEAFSDPAVLADFQTNEDYMPFMHSLMDGADNTISGWLNVSVLGGNTANTEFEYLTGNTMAFLPTGSIPYQQYITGETPSMASYLASLGYKTEAMHPYKATGWDRDKVYPLFGFQETHFLPDYKNPVLVRDYVSDKSDFDKIIESFEQKEEGQPLFLFNVTMQNHSGYDKPWDGLERTAELTGVLAGRFPTVDQYLSLIKQSDNAFRYLIDYFSQVEEPTMILLFGDHQPQVATSFYTKMLGGSEDTWDAATAQKRQAVPFVIWANYDIPEAEGVELSLNYLSALLAETANLPQTGYQQFLNELRQTVPVVNAVGFRDTDGTWVRRRSQLSAGAQAALKEYEMLQYNVIFDKTDAIADFFTLPTQEEAG